MKKPTEIEITMGTAMLGARLHRELTQKELAKRAGVSQIMVSQIENGLRNVSHTWVVLLADVLDVCFVVTRDGWRWEL